MKKTITAICVAYIFLLPFQLLPVFRTLRNAFSRSAAFNNCMFIMIAGLLLLLIYTGGTLHFHSDLMRRGVIMIFILIGLSLLTSLILLPVFGTLHSENSITASLPTNIYYAVMAAAFFFNAHVYEFISKEKMRKIMDVLCVFHIVLGLIQLAVMVRIPAIYRLYDQLDIMDIFTDGGKIMTMSRITLTGSEPSSIGITVCCFMMPYAMSQMICDKNKRRYLFFVVMFTVFCFFALSSAVVVALLANYLFLFLTMYKRAGAAPFVISALVGVILFIGIVSTGIFDETEFGQKISFLLVEKTTDTSNLSSGYRYTTVVNDIVCFLKYPVSGVGNGNQGFLYNDTMNSSWVTEAMRTNYQTVKVMSGSAGVLSGGAFVPAFISGYGIIGLVLLASYIGRIRKTIREKKTELGYYYYWFIIGMLTFLVISTAAGSIEGNFPVIFVLCLPFAAEHNLKLEGAEANGPENLRRHSYFRPRQ